MTTMLTVSAVTPGEVAPPLSPTNFGMQGGLCTVMASCSSAPGAHLPLSPAVGLPRTSRGCVAAAPRTAAEAPGSVDWVTPPGPLSAPTARAAVPVPGAAAAGPAVPTPASPLFEAAPLAAAPPPLAALPLCTLLGDVAATFVVVEL